MDDGALVDDDNETERLINVVVLEHRGSEATIPIGVGSLPFAVWWSYGTRDYRGHAQGPSPPPPAFGTVFRSSVR